MIEDPLYSQLREKLKDDFAPVKPLKATWKRAFWLFPISLLYMVVTLAIFHIRHDYANLSPLVLWGFFLLQILVCYLVLAASLEACIPGSVKDPLVLAGIGLMGPGVFFVASWTTFHISPNWPIPGQEWRMGMICMSVIGMFGILALLFGFLLAGAGLPFRAKATGLLLGIGSGLTAEAAWRLHCPFSSWDHILPFHGGTVFLIIVLGIIIGHLWKRKALR